MPTSLPASYGLMTMELACPAESSKRIECGLHLGRMLLGFCLEGNPDDFPVFDKERLAFAKGHADNPRNAECFGNLAILVGDKGEGQLVFFLELLLGLRGVAADPEDLKVLPVEIGEGIAERAGLGGAARRIGFGVEIYECRAFGIDILEYNRCPILIRSSDLGCGRADFESVETGGKEGKHDQYDCTEWHPRTIFRADHFVNDISQLKKSSIILAAVAVGFLQALPKAFDLGGAIVAAGRGTLGGSMADRIVAWTSRVGGWEVAGVSHSLLSASPWFLGFLVLFFLASRTPTRWRKTSLAVVWLGWFAASASGLWNGWIVWQDRVVDPRLLAPTVLVEKAAGHSQRVFVNPSALALVAAVNRDFIDRSLSHDLPLLVQSTAKWRAEDRKRPFSAVLLAGNLAEARPLIQHLLDAPDWHISRVDNQGILFLHADQPDNFESEIPAFESPRDRAIYLAQYAICLDAAGEKSRANQRMDEALEIAGSDFEILVHAASLAAFQGRWERAKTLAVKADKYRPNTFESQYLLAWSLLETRTFEKAFALTSLLAKSHPNDIAVLMLHARTSRASKDFTTETATLEQLLQLVRNDPNASSRIHLFLGQSWAQRGFPDQALAQYRQALEGTLTPAEARDIREAMKTIEENRLQTGH